MCNEGWGGDCCDCNIGDSVQENEKVQKCYPKDMDKICSGRGQCQCGKCICETDSKSNFNYNFGQHCQCTLDSCPKFDSKICNDKGSCQCGKCMCQEGWKGDNCGCDSSENNCISNCSGNGKCECNKCVCNSDPNGGWSYTGDSCNTFYVECNKYDECKHGDCDLAVKKDNRPGNIKYYRDCIYELPELDPCEFTSETRTAKLQFFWDGNLRYTYDDTYDCQKPVNVKAILFWTIGSTILIGLLIILAMKLIIDWLNYKEYKSLVRDENNLLDKDTRGDEADNGDKSVWD